MRYAEAFNKLGYNLANPRQHWSCASDDGVCISLWRCEIDWKNRKFDTRYDAGPIEFWNAAGASQRKRDLTVARDHFENWIDVVVVDGIPGEGVDEATPWMPADRQGMRWRLTDFDEATGHFRAEMLG